MKILASAFLLALLAAATFSVPSASAALGVVISVSPAEGVVGRPVDILVRTFVPIGEGEADLPPSTLAYPAASGLWNVLYPVADYPFDVVARAEDGLEVPITLVRDISDATLWRGTFTPTASGTWRISVRNFLEAPGATAQLSVMTGEAVPIAAIVGGVGLLAGVVVGLVLCRRGTHGSRITAEHLSI